MTSQLTAASKTLPSSMTTRRSCLAASFVNGKLFAVGGYYGSGWLYTGYNSIESCDVMNGGRWTEAPSKMSQGRVYCAATTIGNSVIVAGGKGSAYSYLSSVEAFNVETGLWRSLPSMSTRRGCCAAVSVGDELIVIGGMDNSDGVRSLDTAESFNVRTGGRWMDLPPMNNTRSHCAAAVINNKLYVVGGEDDETGLASDTVDVFDLSTRRWTLLPHRMTTRRYGCATAALGRYLVVAGGHDGTSILNSVEVYDVDSETWRECPPMTTERRWCAAVSLGGSVFIMGGQAENNWRNRLDSVEEISFNDDVIKGMLVECSGGSWTNDVMPLLRWRASVVHRFDIDIMSMPTLLSRVSEESRVQTVFEILRGEIGIFKHTRRPMKRKRG